MRCDVFFKPLGGAAADMGTRMHLKVSRHDLSTPPPFTPTTPQSQEQDLQGPSRRVAGGAAA